MSHAEIDAFFNEYVYGFIAVPSFLVSFALAAFAIAVERHVTRRTRPSPS